MAYSFPLPQPNIPFSLPRGNLHLYPDVELTEWHYTHIRAFVYLPLLFETAPPSLVNYRLTPIILELGRWRQEDCQKLKVTPRLPNDILSQQ